MEINDKEYWNKFYNKNSLPFEKSDFAYFILNNYIEKGKSLIEMGCGNGRDSIYFSKNGVKVIGVDQAENEINFLNSEFKNDNIEFLCGDFTKLNLKNSFDYVYSRFTIHSIPEDGEDRLLNWSFCNLHTGGGIFIEARSIRDDLYSEGTKISKTENFTDHYRRYVNKDILIKKLKKIGFYIIYEIESKGLAVYKDEDPYIVRIVGKK
ncbi:class I SAM-dependent methyltransferase [uncultured Clostridium sp.]|uniref:class I SAM-dependent methyltransferase n=1 Tax=uncultured Clostridium sp. TaxID=59620 RepID=UPI0025FAE1E8|nr:class I SAM-dependent methyltransferase [uncultured Clostridium sp.]